ncbi:MAG: DUF2723 domain-containing protein [Melioribacter sp.]|nr:DUF2723 domain-containing protein [Melioribacter sp.]
MSDKKSVIYKILPIIISLFVLTIYFFTLAPSVIQIDSGELAAVQATLGIAHPTGYPLFTLVGYLFVKIPLPVSTIYKANLLAAIWCGLGILFFIKSVTLLLANINSKKVEKKLKTKSFQIIEPEESNNLLIKIAAITGSLFLAFSNTYWMQSTSVEVYSLQIFLFMLIIFSSLRAYFSKSNSLFDWTLLGIFTALGFTNHMTTLLSLPFTAILFFRKEGLTKKSLLKIAVTFISSLPVLILLYAYLPLRASTNPEINWGNPFNAENFLRHITGKQYQVWLFSSFDAAKKQFGYFFNNLPSEFTVPGLLLALTGLGYIFKVNKRIAGLITVSFVVALLYSINYDIVDIDSYFLFNFILTGILISMGVFFILKELKLRFKLNERVLVIFSFIGFIPLITNYSSIDQSDRYIFEDYTKNILSSVEKNSIIFSYQWDYFISASYYYQFVENFRKDVVVVDKELLRRSWYYNQLKRNYPTVIKNIENEVDRFLSALEPFESGGKFDPNLLEVNYRNVMTRLVSQNADRDFYVGLELFANEIQRGEFSLPDGYQLVPHLFLFKAVKSDEYIPAPEPDFSIRLPKNKNRYTNFIEDTIGRMLSYRILYELNWNKRDKAIAYYNKLRKTLPEFIIPEQISKMIKIAEG